MKLVILLSLITGLNAQTLGITGSVPILGNISLNGISNPSIPSVPVTAIQALLVYTAPSSSACTIRVSESSGLIPLVYDVDTNLFTGSDSDVRSTSVNNGTARKFIIGSRLPAIANDGKIYSRALQANTLHYYQVTCGTTIINGTFTTMNIPVGSTYNEPYQAHPSVPGSWLIPTITGVRNQIIIDPLTGAKLSAVSIPSDHNINGVGLHLGSGARQHISNLGTHANIDGNGNPGYLLNLDETMGYYGIFTHVPATGLSQALGKIVLSASTKLDDLLQAYSYFAPNTTQYNYTGAYASRDESLMQNAQFDGGTSYLTTAIPDLVHNFDSTFDTTYFGCEPISLNDLSVRYTTFKCLRSSQDSYGWIAVFDSITKTVVAAWNTFITQTTKFCGIHEYVSLNNIVPNINMASVYFHNLAYGNTDLGTASISTTLTSGISNGATQFIVTGAPASMATGGDPYTIPTVTVGDTFRTVESGGSFRHTITALSGTGNTTWTFTPAVSSALSSSAPVSMDCNAALSLVDNVWTPHYWRFNLDIHGTDLTGTYVIPDIYIGGGGHDDFQSIGRVEETPGGWSHHKITSTLLVSLNQPGVSINKQVAFAGITAPAPGVALTLHPSIQQTTTDPWFLDFAGFNGGACCSSPINDYFYSKAPGLAVTNVSGSLYKYFSDAQYPLHRKIFPTQAVTGGKSLRDISGPTSIIGDTSTYNYQFCVVYIANECHNPSSPGDIFFNVPALTIQWCPSYTGPFPGNADICINDTPAFSNAIVQMYMGTTEANSLANSRTLSYGIVGIRNVVGYPLAKATPDGLFSLFTIGAGYVVGQTVVPIDVWKVKIPPLPVSDGIDRTSFISTPIAFDTVISGTNKVAVKFWYNSGFCGSRAEDCYATGSTVPIGNDPYFYPTDNFTGLSCTISCSVAVPALSQRILYYQKYYYDISNANIGVGPIEVRVIQ